MIYIFKGIATFETEDAPLKFKQERFSNSIPGNSNVAGTEEPNASMRSLSMHRLNTGRNGNSDAVRTAAK